MIQLLPQWMSAAALDPSQLAPDQVWNSAEGQSQGHVPAGQDVNRAEARSELSRYPQPRFPEEAPKRNAVREVEAPGTFKGFDAANSKEDPSKRDENSRTFGNPDGTLTTEYSQSPTNYRKQDGSWAEIDTKLVKDGNGWRNAADSTDTRFAGTASESPFVSMKLANGGEFAFGLAGTSAAPARVNGSTVVYPGVGKNTDLRLDVTPGGVKETLVLSGADAETGWTFPLRLAGLQAKVVDNAVVLTDGAGNVAATIPAGHMVDAAGAYSAGVKYELVPHNGGQALKMTADADWIRDGARKFPIAVDPSVTGPNASQGMTTSGGTRVTGDQLTIGNGSVMYLKFTANGMQNLANHRVFGAQLYLTNFDAPSCRPEPITVHEVTGAWSESGSGHPASNPAVLGSASFAHGHVALGQSQSACPQSGESIDLGEGGRDLVQRWVKGQTANNGLAVKAVRSWKTFVGTRASANQPKLFITHTPHDAAYRVERGMPEPPVHRLQDGFVKIAVTNRSGATWTKEAGYKFAYRAFRTDGRLVASNVAAELPRAVAPGETATLDAKITRLDPGDYLLDFSMMHGNTYFTDEQIPPARLSLTVFNLPPIVKGQYPPAGHNAPTLTPQLWADAVDVDSTPEEPLKYEFRVCTSKTDGSPNDTADTCKTSPRVQSKTWTVPKGWLKWSQTYHWRSTAYDPSGQPSEALPFSALLTSVPQPDITSHLGGAPYSAGDLDFDPQIGNYTTGAVDAAVVVTGPELSIARTYNSLDPREDGLFGAGWSTRFDMRVVPDNDGSGNVVVTYPDGQAVRFGKNPDNGSFSPPPGRFATFYQDMADPERPYVLVDKANNTYRFRQTDGRVIRNFDNAGRNIELDYDANGQLKRAISRTSGNRTLYFTWTGGHVTEVKTDAPATGGTPIRWTYEYVGDQLKKVCDPNAKCTQYNYEQGSHYRSMVMDAKPDSYWRLGEPSGEHAVSQVATNLNKDWGVHNNTTLGVPGPLANNPDTAASFNGSNSFVKLPAGAIKKSRDLSVEMWFRTTSGGPLIGFQSKPFDATDNFSALPALFVDKDGKLRGQFWHGRYDPITTSVAVNDGEWHHVVLTGSLATQSMYLDGAKVGSTEGEIDDSLLNYGQIGAARVLVPEFWPGWWAGEGKKHFAGDIDEVALYQRPLGQETVRGHFLARGHSDQLTSVTMPSGRVAARLSYDVVNDRLREYTDENGGVWKLGVPAVSGTEKQQPDGRTVRNLVRTIEVTDPGRRPHFFDYDPVKGRIIRFGAPLGTTVRHEDRADPSAVPTTPTSAPPCSGVPPPNPDGSPGFCGGPGSGAPDWAGGPAQGIGVRSYEYDESGFQHKIADENGHQVQLVHDARGNVVSRTSCREPGICDTEHFTYFQPAPGSVNDTDPRIDKQLEARDGRSSGPTDNRYLTKSEYNTRGDLTKQTMPDGSTVVHGYVESAIGAVPRPGQTTVGNEPMGLLKSTTDGRNKTTTFRYHDNGDLFEKVEPNGLRTQYAYDNLGRKTSEKEISDSYPQGLETKFVHDGLNHPVEVTDAGVKNAVDGKVHTKHTRTTFNADGQPEKVEISDLTGQDATRTISYTYDDRGRQDSVTDGEGNKTSYGYDNFGNRTFVVDALGTRIEYAYTARNKVAEVRLRGWHGKPVSGGIGQSAEEKDAGRLLVLEANTYDLGGRLIRSVDSMGRRTIYEYTPNGLVARVLAEIPVQGAQPRRVLLEENKYDGAGHLVRKVSAGGKVEEFVIDAAGRVDQAIADPAGLNRRTTYRYDGNGNVTQTTASGKGSNTGTLNLDTSRVVDYAYDDTGNQVSETMTSGTKSLVTSRTFDQRGLKLTETDPRGNVAGADKAAFTTTFRYDEAERQVAVKHPVTAVETATEAGETTVVTRAPESFVGYNTFGEEVQAKDENGQVVLNSYDKIGRLTRTETPEYRAPGATAAIRGVIERKYDAVGNAIEVVDPRGAVTRYRFDQQGRMVEQQDPKADAPTEVGGVWKYTYTHKGEQLSATDPTGARTEATYDELGRKITESVLERKPVSAAFTTTFEYFDGGELKQVTSPAPANDITKFAYDALGQRTSTTDAANVTTQYGYDGLGRQSWQRDALGRTSYVRHDAFGRMNGQFSLDGTGNILRNSTYAHDDAGNVVTATDAMKRSATYTYDALNRIVSQVEPVTDTSSITTSFGYDAAGHRTRYTDGRGNRFLTTYNSWSLPEKVIEPSTAAHPALADRTWTSVYDASGNAVRMTAPGNVVRETAYDSLGRLKSETGAGAAATSTRERVYDLAGRLKEMDAPGGRNVYDYDDRSGVLSASGPSGTSSFEYDEQGRLKTRTDAAGTARFSYAHGRLSTMTDPLTGVGQVVTYNEAGQLKKIQYGSVRSREIDYDALGRQKSDVLKTAAGAVESSASYEYNNNDALTRKVTSGLAGSGDHTYTYDYANRLKSWTVGGVTTAYSWDGSGNRTQNGAKTAAYDERNRLLSDGDYTYRYSPRGTMESRTSSGMEEKFSFDAFDRLIAVGKTTYAYDGADRVVSRGTKSFAYAGFDIDPVSDGNALYGRGASGELLSISEGGVKRLALSDKHGDVVGGFDPTATSGVADSAAFDPFGVRTATTGSSRSVGYQGDWTDPDTKQVNMGARWYQPGTGAFASRDSVSASSGPSVLFNRYTYGAGRPLDMVDPDGHWPDWGKVWNGVKTVAKVGLEVVKEVSGYNDVANFIREPSWANAFWAVSNFIPGGKLLKAGKYLVKYADDVIGGARRYGDDVVGAARRYGDDLANGARRYGDDLARAGSRVADFAKTAAKQAVQLAARKAAAEAAARAARIAAMQAITKRAKAAIAYAAKHNPLPIQKAALTPKIAAKDLVSSAPNLPARKVGALAENVQDVNKTWDIIKATVVKPGVSVIQTVAEEAVTDFAASQVPGVGDVLSLLGGSKKRGNGKAKEAGERSRGAAGASCPVQLDLNSFSGDTPVLMADGSRKPIKDIELGDEVVATDPTTGERAVKKVSDVRSYRTDHEVYEVQVASSSGVGKIVATDEHPFWVANKGRWVETEELEPGYTFTTGDNRPATVLGKRTFTGSRLVYNLTVDAIHTYFVGATGDRGATADVLVHNTQAQPPSTCPNNSYAAGLDVDVVTAARGQAMAFGVPGAYSSKTRPGASEAIRLTNGNVYMNGSSKTPIYVHPAVQTVLDAVARAGEPSRNHGRCGLIACLSDAIYREGVSAVQGAEVAAFIGRTQTHPSYLNEMDPCKPSCHAVVQHFGLNFRTRDPRGPQ
ncbi:LamG-like jellyroll fold domain-containing protein [Lentzea xinjiangensis]|nr:LamG-like jellyroll fold domain-containing protein [Lentzea xinjiangensis]